jgi:tetratricopeptide (TPR) repeat protein
MPRNSSATSARGTGRARVRGFLVALALAVVAARTATAQTTVVLARAMQQETNGDMKAAAASYREALAHGDVVPALLGLERVFAQLGWNDSIVPIVDSAVAKSPREPIARTMQLRVLRTLRRDAESREAFASWVRAAPGDIAPYREWARLLLAEGRVSAVDSVLTEARRVLGSTSGLTVEVAQVRSALGQWDYATAAWREAVVQQDYLETAATFSLRAAPADSRRVVRAILLGAPVERSARHLLASLELTWGNGREAWLALKELPLSDSTATMWTAFAEDAERRGQWLPARDALLAVQAWRPDGQRALRAASLALDGGDPESALQLAVQAAKSMPRDGEKTVLNIRLRAYVTLGRGLDAQRAFTAVSSQLSPAETDANRKLVAWAWVRGGGVVEARAMLNGAAPDPDDELTGWLALYDGDLAGARRGLRRADPRVAAAAFAVAFVSRTRINQAPLAGKAFLTLARGDSAGAALAFARAASEVPDGASILLLAAASVQSEQKHETQAIALWQQIIEMHATTPEAAEAELDWSKLLRKRGDKVSAIAHLEHLILSWPDSALLPQARRELELARGAIPGGGGVTHV